MMMNFTADEVLNSMNDGGWALYPESAWKDVSTANGQRPPVQALPYTFIKYSYLKWNNMLMENVGDTEPEG